MEPELTELICINCGAVMRKGEPYYLLTNGQIDCEDCGDKKREAETIAIPKPPDEVA